MRAGVMRDRITLERVADPSAVDSRGEPSPAWVSLGSFPARVRLVSAKEIERLSQLQGRADWAIELRDPVTITVKETDRVLFGAKTINLTGVIMAGPKRDELTLYGVEATSGMSV